jgi:tetratricopeptide (TPR) repeat protein
MDFSSKLIWRFAVTLFLNVSFCTFALAQGSTASTLSPAVQKLLQAAQESLKKGQSEQAVGLAKEALAMPQLSVFELTWIHRVLGTAAFNSKNFDLAVGSFEHLAGQSDISVAEKRPFLERLISLAQKKKDHEKVVRWSRQYLSEGGSNPMVRTVLIQTLSFLNAHEDVIKEVQSQLQLDAAEKRKSSETILRMLAVSHRALKNMAAYEGALFSLLENYPGKAYWREVIEREAQKPNANPRLELDFYRLLVDTDNLLDKDEFMEMAHLALKLGMPAEALRVLDSGFEKKILSKGVEGAAELKLRAQALAQNEKDEKVLVQLERTAKEGNDLSALADVHASKNQWTQSTVYYAKALSAGGLRRATEVQLHYGIALIKAGEVEKGVKVLEAVKDDPTAVILAKLWRLRAMAS